MRYQPGGTYIGQAINYANEQLMNTSTSEADRVELMLIVTDGVSSDDPKKAADRAR